MPQTPKLLDPTLSPRHRFGAELRAIRVRSGMSQAELAGHVHVHPDLIAKVEKAQRWPTEELATSCDKVLSSSGTLAALWEDVAFERQGVRTLAQSSTSADNVDQPTAPFESVGDVANRLWRLGKAGQDAALSLLGGRIAEVVEEYETQDPATLAPTVVTLRRVLEPMVHTQLTERQRQRVYTLAGRTSGLLSYMAVNLGRFSNADAYATEAYVLADEAGDRGLMAWVRGTQSFASYYRKDYRQAVEYARDGIRAAGEGPQALRLRVNCEARALAFLPGHRRDAENAVSAAYKLADQLDVPPGISSCISFEPYSRGRVVANAITVFQTLGEAEQAEALVRDVGESVDGSNSAWSRSLVDLDHATMLLRRNDPDVDQAMHLACRALATSADRPITSIVQRGQGLLDHVAEFSTLPSVREFKERLRMIAAASHRRQSVTLASR
jgi:transcriptional regulator with XRE-family HTH domain